MFSRDMVSGAISTLMSRFFRHTRRWLRLWRSRSGRRRMVTHRRQFGAAHVVQAVAVAPIAAGQEPAHALVVEPAEHALMIDRLLLLPIRAFTGHLEKIPLQVFTQVRHPVVRPFPAGHRPPPRRVVLLCPISGQILSGRPDSRSPFSHNPTGRPPLERQYTFTGLPGRHRVPRAC